MNKPRELNVGKIRRQRVFIEFHDRKAVEIQVADIAMPTPDGNYFIVRDLTKGEDRDSAVDRYFPRGAIRGIEITSRLFWMHSDKSRGDEVVDEPLDKAPEKTESKDVEAKDAVQEDR